jgi:pimeloyl-ACP methyl ester carboxylesterase
MPAPLMLLPGLICDASIFASQIDRFRAAPCAVQALDGFGAIDSLEAMARETLRIGPPRMSLLGHSMGGRVALEVWRLAPERVERLALVSTGVHGVTPGEAAKRYALRELGRSEGGEALVDQWLPPMVAPANQADAGLMNRLRAMCIGQGVETYAAQIEALLNRPDATPLLATLDRPTLVCTGELDGWAPPAQHAAIAAVLPRATLQVVKGAGHMLPTEAPDAMNAVIADWLALPL